MQLDYNNLSTLLHTLMAPPLPEEEEAKLRKYLDSEKKRDMWGAFIIGGIIFMFFLIMGLIELYGD